MKYADRCPYVDSEKSARRLLKIANPFEPGQGGRIQIEKIKVGTRRRNLGLALN